METSLELEIIQDCHKGNFLRFTLLYDAYADRIYRFIYYKTHHKQTAEDITSITFTKALENIARFNAYKASFSTWLYHIARNTIIDYYRTTKKIENIEDIWDLADDTDTMRDADIALQAEKIRHYMKELKPQQRDIIIMRLWQGLSYEEIAEITSSTHNATKMMFSRSLKTLREKIPIDTFMLFMLF